MSFVFVAYDTQLSLPQNKRVCFQYLMEVDCFTFCQIEAYFKLTFYACKLKYFPNVYDVVVAVITQGSNRLEKYWKIAQRLEKSLKSTIPVGHSTANRVINQYKIVVRIFAAAYAAPNKGTTILYQFSVSIISGKHI